MNKLEDSSNLKAINEEETKLLNIIMGKEETKPVVRAAPKRRKKKAVEIPPPNLKPFMAMIIGGIVAAAVGGGMFAYLFMIEGADIATLFFAIEGLLMVLVPIIVGVVLIAVGALKRSKARSDYAEAKRRAQTSAEEEAEPEGKE